jgi:hypothetical protein
MRRSIALMPAMIMVSIAGLLLMPTLSQSRGGGGQVTVTPTADKVIAWSAVGGGVEESLQPGESVVTSGARGHTGFVQTSNRLLGFSAGLRQWREVSLGVEERIVRHQLLPFLILAHSNQQVYGFQETRGHWTDAVTWAERESCPAARVTGMWPSPSPTNARIGIFDLHRRFLLTSPGRRMSGCCPSTAVRTAWSSGPRPAPSSSSRNPPDGPRCDSDSPRTPITTYIRPSSSSIASTQVVAGGSAVTGTPRFVAMSCRRP